MSSALTIGVSGLGSIGRRHARLLGQLGVRVVAFDAMPDPAGFDGVQLVDSFERLLDSGLDGIVIASPDEAHLEQAGAACRAGVPVLVEKPLAAGLEAGRELQGVARESSTPVLVGYVLRHTSALRRVRELLDDEAVGRVASVHALLGAHETMTVARNRFAKVVPYRLVYDYSHEWDYLGWLCGAITRVAATGRKLPDPEFDENPNSIDGVLEFSSQISGTFHLDYVQRRSAREVTIVGEGGSLRADLRSGVIRIATGDDRVEELGEPRDAAFERQLRHFLDVVRGRERPLVPASDGLWALAVAEAVRESLESGRWASVAA